jgi:hypothetical protein
MERARIMKTQVKKQADYRVGYPWLVFTEGRLGGWVIDSWHKTKREADATARDIENIKSEGQ